MGNASHVMSIDANKYSIAQESTIGTAVVSGDLALLVTELEVDYPLGATFNVAQKARGVSYLKKPSTGGADITVLNRSQAGPTLPIMANADSLALPLATFAQNISRSGAGPYVEQYDPMTTDAHRRVLKGATSGDYGLTLLKRNDDDGTRAETLAGCIMRALTLTSSEDNPLNASLEFIGMTADTENDVNVTASFTDVDKDPILHSDLTVAIGGTDVDLISQTITLSYERIKIHNANNNEPQGFIFGRVNVALDLVIPWQESTSYVDYKAAALAKTDYLYEMYKGSKTGATAEDFYFKSNFVFSEDPKIEEIDGMKVWHLIGTGMNDGTNPAYQIILATATSRITTM